VAEIVRDISVFLLAIAAAGACAGAGDSLNAAPAVPLRIAHVYYNGNHVTKERVIRMFAGLDTGMAFDSLKVRKAKKRLEATGLFLKVAIIPLVKNGAVDLYVIVREPFYFGLTALDLTPYTLRHGESGTWYCPLAGVEFTNVRGCMETLQLSLRAWEWRMAAVSWSKPLFPSRYFIGIGVFADAGPDNALPIDRMELFGSVTAGRKLFEQSKIYCRIMPDYQRKIGLSGAQKDTTDFYQAFGAVGWFTDRRSSSYDPSAGWSLFLETRSNVLYHEATTPFYVQFTSDIKAYHPGLFKNHKAACRLSVISRTNDAGIQNRLVLGGLGSVRGYANCGIDLRSVASHSLLLSWEYRFPLYQLPPFSPPLPSKVSTIAGKFVGDLNDLVPRIDGALILDYGRVARNRPELLTFDRRGYVSGADFGFGLRVMEPKLRRSVCLDVVWAEKPLTPKVDFYSAPWWVLYLDLYF
jgi:hypothetical protein